MGCEPGSRPVPRPSARSLSAARSVSGGRSAEWLAILFLTCKGYRLLARRYGGKGGEIDLVMRRGQIIIFVEVKARAALDDALNAITPAKRRLMMRRIRDWKTRNPWASGLIFRVDAVFIGHGGQKGGWRGGRSARWIARWLGPWPRHLENAFEIDDP